VAAVVTSRRSLHGSSREVGVAIWAGYAARASAAAILELTFKLDPSAGADQYREEDRSLKPPPPGNAWDHFTVDDPHSRAKMRAR
jgi:hypothetical protein